jgi:hypothetical protein
MEKKGLIELWELIDMPVIIAAGWIVLNFIVPINSIIPNNIVSGIINWVVSIGIFGLIGYNCAKQKKELAVKAGALAGAIIGLLGAIVGFLQYYIFPDRFLAMMGQAAGNISRETMMSWAKIGLFIGLVTGPLFSAIFGLIIAFISYKIFEKTLKNDKNEGHENAAEHKEHKQKKHN